MSDIFNRTWTAEEKARLKNLLSEGAGILSDIQSLKEGLRDTVASISEELEIPKRALNKAIRTYYKNNIDDEKEKISEIEGIFAAIGN